MGKIYSVLLLFIACSVLFVASRNVVQDDEQQVEMLLRELRCVTCPNQNIADSTAPIASAMREEILQRYQKGESTQAIREYLLNQYGDYLSYRPLVKPQTWLLWFGPLLMLLLGIILWFSFLKNKK
ncbi:MAG: cytochrome c-type biogenesis protein CcmH [Proteobacteria bacterium]|nr:cytochrome c-type biogenesis protein CcmH [Pseudomonadota bacterium]